MAYHALRVYGNVPLTQIGMNVKMCIRNPQTEFFRAIADNRSEGYQGLCEPTPDIVVFEPEIAGDWRRRRCLYSEMSESPHMLILMEMEIKASERSSGRLTSGEIEGDIEKLTSHRKEIVFARTYAGLPSADIYQVMLIIDTAPLENERMKLKSLESARRLSAQNGIQLCYIAPESVIF